MPASKIAKLLRHAGADIGDRNTAPLA